MEFLLLHHRGRKSGRPFITPLLCIETDTGFVVAASNGGDPRFPAWWQKTVLEVQERWPKVLDFMQNNPWGQRIRAALEGQQEAFVDRLQQYGGKALSAGAGFFRAIGTLVGWAVLPVYFAFFLSAGPASKANVYCSSGDCEVSSPGRLWRCFAARLRRRGKVDMTRGLNQRTRLTTYQCSSPPVIVNDVIVIGSIVFDRPAKQQYVRGDVRGYDVRTGAYKWTFHTVPLRGQPGVEFRHATRISYPRSRTRSGS